MAISSRGKLHFALYTAIAVFGSTLIGLTFTYACYGRGKGVFACRFVGDITPPWLNAPVIAVYYISCFWCLFMFFQYLVAFRNGALPWLPIHIEMVVNTVLALGTAILMSVTSNVIIRLAYTGLDDLLPGPPSVVRGILASGWIVSIMYWTIIFSPSPQDYAATQPEEEDPKADLGNDVADDG